MPTTHKLLSTNTPRLMPGRNTTLRTPAQNPPWMDKLLKQRAFQKGAKMKNGYGFGSLNRGQ